MGQGNASLPLVSSNFRCVRKVICKAYDFDSFVPSPLTFIGFLSTISVKLIGVTTPLPVSETVKIDLWNYLMIDRYIHHDEKRSGYHASPETLKGDPRSEIVEASRSAHCPLLRAGFVDLDAHVMHNVVVPNETQKSQPFTSYLVDLDSLIPIYVYIPLRFLIRAMGAEGSLGSDFTLLAIFGEMRGEKRYISCLDKINFGLWDIVKLFWDHVLGILRGGFAFFGRRDNTRPMQDL